MAYWQGYLPFAASGLLLFSMASWVGAEGEGRTVRDRAMYLKHDGGTYTHYLELRADGSYRRVARGPQYSEERDRGTWQQTSSRNLLLRSDAHLRNISAGDLFISMRQPERLKTLPDLKQRIQAFLKAHRSQEFPAEDIERIRETTVGSDPPLKISDITVLGSKWVQRSDVEKLVIEIDRFLASSEKNLFTLVPVEYKTAIIYVDDDRAELTKKIIADELAGSSALSSFSADRHGYQEIGEAQFLKETSNSQAVSLSREASESHK
ncbi:MAG: hypothetical protein NNA23_04800 [Nitrospira sp.]|nr:hypothetical protein [Nitrospira sp.]MCP9463845.1 hypothetical protein [Nitrospira sp.]